MGCTLGAVSGLVSEVKVQNKIINLPAFICDFLL